MNFLWEPVFIRDRAKFLALCTTNLISFRIELNSNNQPLLRSVRSRIIQVMWNNFKENRVNCANLRKSTNCLRWAKLFDLDYSEISIYISSVSFSLCDDRYDYSIRSQLLWLTSEHWFIFPKTIDFNICKCVSKLFGVSIWIW